MNKEQIVEILGKFLLGNMTGEFVLDECADEIMALQIVEDRGWYNNIEFNCPLCNKRIAIPVDKEGNMTTEEKHEFALELVRTGQIGAKTYNVIYAYLYGEK